MKGKSNPKTLQPGWRFFSKFPADVQGEEKHKFWVPEREGLEQWRLPMILTYGDEFKSYYYHMWGITIHWPPINQPLTSPKPVYHSGAGAPGSARRQSWCNALMPSRKGAPIWDWSVRRVWRRKCFEKTELLFHQEFVINMGIYPPIHGSWSLHLGSLSLTTIKQ